MEEDVSEYNQNNGTNYIFIPIGRYEVCPAGSYKIALTIDPYEDYHWYRQDADGLWSHKQGTTAVRRTDNAGNRIVDPQLASGRYSEFIGYFAVTPWNNYYANVASLVSEYTSDELPMVDMETINNLEIGMTLEEVVSIIGFEGVDIGSGLLIHQYTLNNGATVVLGYSIRADGQWVLDGIRKE